MKKKDVFKKKVNNFMYDHVRLNMALKDSKAIFFAALAALVYAFAFICFITPYETNPSTFAGSSVITGGVGGISQVFYQLFALCGVKTDQKTIQSIFYFALNIPILIFSFFKIGKRFTFFSLVNVGLSSLFIQVLPYWDLLSDITRTLSQESFLIRVIFAGAFVGVASAIAYKADVSCGGVDVISYYFAIKKSTSVGKYTAALNAIVIVTYTCLTVALNKGSNNDVALLNLLFSIIYLLVTSLIIDKINIRNKKVQIQIITENPAVSPVLIANFPHSNTTLAGVGGYQHKNKIIILMVASSNEMHRIVSTVKKADPNAFVTITQLHQAYGNFFIKPIE